MTLWLTASSASGPTIRARGPIRVTMAFPIPARNIRQDVQEGVGSGRLLLLCALSSLFCLRANCEAVYSGPFVLGQHENQPGGPKPGSPTRRQPLFPKRPL